MRGALEALGGLCTLVGVQVGAWQLAAWLDRRPR